jgi:pimeloyl-ACP methyl ester carboxylesterase
MHEAIKGSQFLVLEGAGHVAPLQAPKTFADALLGFVGR